MCEVRRGGVVESRHFVHVAVTDSDGRLLLSAGDPFRPTFLRSATKPFQALPFVELAHERSFRTEHIAIACSSHGGTPEHVEAVAALAWDARVDLAWLQCGAHEPLDPSAARALRRLGEDARPVHHNCSGKHVAMLAVCVAQGWPTETYLATSHPLQQAILASITAAFGQPPLHVAIDGCSAPTFVAPLASAAHAFSRLLDTERIAPEGSEWSLRRAGVAMQTHPRMVAGPGRLDTVAMENVPDLVSKEGAEGVWLAACATRAHGPVGMALKVEDGAERARSVTGLATLGALGVLDPTADPFAAWARPTLRNSAGLTVGELVFELEDLTERSASRRENE